MTGGSYNIPHYYQQEEAKKKNGNLINGKAADTYAEITRQQYEDWLTTFYPKQKELLQKSQDGSLLNEQLTRVDGNINSAVGAANSAKKNQMARYGVNADADPNQAAKQSLATATMKNSLRENERDRSLNALIGGNARTMETMKEQ